jgi:uncharacterized protein (TIGR02391 family)
MNVTELKGELEKFHADLRAHQDLWQTSLDDIVPNPQHPKELRAQSKRLTRTLGKLRPYIERFKPHWVMQHPARGVTWDALDAAVSNDEVAKIKAASLNALLASLDQIIGRLEAMQADDIVPENRDHAIGSGAPADKIMMAYLQQLHPTIAKGCTKLFLDGHFIQAIEESCKAVFQHIRDRSGLKGDGAALIEKAFSVKNPILAFSDLSDETKHNEQIGFMEMLKGYAKGVRNPLAHTHGKQEEMNKAFEFLVMASLFCRRIDDSGPERLEL